MEEEKAAAYYDELTRKGSGAAKFKQGLGFSSTSNDVVPSKGSALPSSTSFLSNFVRASKTDDEIDKEGRLQSIQNKLKSKSKSKSNKTETQRIENENDYQSSRSSRENHTQSNRRNRSRSRSFSRNRNRSQSLSRDRGRQRNSKNRSRSRSRDKYLRRKRSMERDSRRRSRSRSRDRDSRGRSRSRERSLSRRSRSREWDSRRRSRSRSRERSSRRRSRSRSRERSSRRRSRSRSRERSSTRRSRSRSRERDSRRISRSRVRRSRRISRSRSRSGGDEGRGGRLSKRNETSTSVKNERNGGLDYSKLIDGYDKMAPAERVKAKMKLQLTETAKKDPTRGTGSGWERFDFDKDAALDDEEEIEAAEDDSGIVKRIGQSFRFSAVEARKEDQIKAAHDEAMFGAPSLPLSSEIDEEKEDSPKCINDSAPDTSLISNQVISMQQVSWRDRVKKM